MSGFYFSCVITDIFYCSLFIIDCSLYMLTFSMTFLIVFEKNNLLYYTIHILEQMRAHALVFLLLPGVIVYCTAIEYENEFIKFT